jgi:hypothetical protein
MSSQRQDQPADEWNDVGLHIGLYSFLACDCYLSYWAGSTSRKLSRDEAEAGRGDLFYHALAAEGLCPLMPDADHRPYMLTHVVA